MRVSKFRTHPISSTSFVFLFDSLLPFKLVQRIFVPYLVFGFVFPLSVGIVQVSGAQMSSPGKGKVAVHGRHRNWRYFQTRPPTCSSLVSEPLTLDVGGPRSLSIILIIIINQDSSFQFSRYIQSTYRLVSTQLSLFSSFFSKLLTPYTQRFLFQSP